MINAKFAICNEVFDNYLLLLNLEKSRKLFEVRSFDEFKRKAMGGLKVSKL